MSTHNAILAENFPNPDEMFKWIFNLIGSEVEYEDAPSAPIVDILSVTFDFYPIGVFEIEPGSLLCAVVVSVEDVENKDG